MPGSKRLILVAMGLSSLIGLGTTLVIWPNYRESARIHRRIAELQTKAADLESERQALVTLTEQVEQARQRVTTDLKLIPNSPDVADLIKRLSLLRDGATVLRPPEWRTGETVLASSNEQDQVRATPLTVEMDAKFEAVLAVVRSIESLDRLVRITSIRMTANRTPPPPMPGSLGATEKSKDGAADPSVRESPWISASVAMEAVYVGASTEEANQQ